MNKRPSWQKYFLDMAFLVSERSTCLRRKVGAVIVKNNQVLATGYNGAPKHIAHCEEVGGCLRERLKVKSGERHELCRGVHAEQNAIIQAAVNGSSIKDAELYCTTQPCAICAKMIINSEIKKVYVVETYDDELGIKMFKEAGIEFIKLERETGKMEKIF